MNKSNQIPVTFNFDASTEKSRCYQVPTRYDIVEDKNGIPHWVENVTYKSKGAEIVVNCTLIPLKPIYALLVPQPASP